MSELAIPASHPAVRSGPLRDGEWEQLAKVANTIAATEFVPKGLRGNKPAVMAAILYGRDQGLSPMVALSEIHMVDGKPTMSAALVAGKVRIAGHRVWAEEVFDGNGQIVAMTARGERTDGTKDSFTFTLDMARRAGLAGKQNWQKYPEAMLWARAVTGLARRLFSDVFMGSVYTADEMGAETDEDGQVFEGEIVDEGSVGDRGETPAAGGEPLKGGAPAPAEQSPFAKPASVPEQKPPTAKTKTLLNILVDRVVGAGRVTKPELWSFCGVEPDAPGDTASFSLLRDRLTMHEASVLVDHLVALEESAIADGALAPRKAA